MKRFFTLILAILAVMACTPNLEPEEQDPTVTTKRRRI